MKKQIVGLLIIGVLAVAGTAWADKGWTTVATLKAGSEAQAVNVGRPVSKVAITCTDGNITIQNVSVFVDKEKTTFNVASKIKKGETQQISVGDKIQCSRLTVLVEGQGEYQVRVR